MQELKPCPFCGGNPVAIETRPGRGELYCGNCDVVLGGNNAMTAEELTGAWNTRAERTCNEVLVDKHWRGCSECAYKWEFMYGIAECKRPNYCPNCGARITE